MRAPAVTRGRLALLLLYLLLIGGGLWLGHVLPGALDVAPGAPRARLQGMLALVAGAYLLASALPFVPGAEIGLALIVTLGAPVAPLVYLCMVAALALAFLAGRLVPPRLLAAGFAALRMERAAALVRETEGLDPEARRARFAARAPHRLLPVLLRHPYLALALALNLPGNALLGGGGGLALAAGMSGVYRLLPTLVTILLAVAPFPALVLLTGYAP